jgi:uncharacterized protein
VDDHGCTEAEAIRILNTAIDRGIRYFDTAWVYSAGQSEERVGKVAKHRRQEMWIATKVRARDRATAQQQLETSLRRLQTDHVDEWRLHNVVDEDDLERCFAADGVIHAALGAKEQGATHRIGISGHTHPQVLVEALRRFPFDSVMFPGSVLDHFVMSAEDELLPLAAAQGVGTVAMKVLGLGKLKRWYEPALRYSLGLPAGIVLVGCSKLEELERDLAVAEGFVPLDDDERQQLFRTVEPLVTPANVPWKTPDWGAGGRWLTSPPSALRHGARPRRAPRPLRTRRRRAGAGRTGAGAWLRSGGDPPPGTPGSRRPGARARG